MNHLHTNSLINETSVYLLQHAHNPVNWYAWGEEALQKALTEDKPILVSIGYAACHWCHVMEHESFENEETAAYMNEHFINIKIDREERPDLDHIYMDAVQAISGSGGWPLNVFLTPDKKPFYGGTYYPPVRAFNRMSWVELLQSITEMFAEKRNEVEAQADNLLDHISSANVLAIKNEISDERFTREALNAINDALLKQADKEWGGFGNAPKFPQTFSIQYLLRHYYFTGNEDAIKQALLSLDKMIYGGIYDQAGGGFARYSTDAKWLAPHFEKMLYDNALLLSTLSEAYQVTGKGIYTNIISKTVEFLVNEMTAPGGAFYSALDADSEGFEGKFYTWSKAEIDVILGNDSNWFCNIYDISEAGNWEHTNILWLPNGIAEDDLQKANQFLGKILAERNKRIRPQTDDKIILGWNALMITGLCKAYAATGIEKYLSMAENCFKFLEQNLLREQQWQHSWKNNIASHAAFLDDYAYLIQACIQLQEVTADENYLLKAKTITELVINDFWDEEKGFFFFTPSIQKDVVIRKKELYDGAVPSGNSVMAGNIYYLSIVFDKREWKDFASKMILSTYNAITKYPVSFGVWASVLQNFVYGFNEITLTGKNSITSLKRLHTYFIPNKIVQASISAEIKNEFALFKGKNFNEESLIYLCKNQVCGEPVTTVEQIIKNILV